MKTQPNIPAVTYSRVSTDEQEKDGFSIPAQHKLLRNYAATEGIEIQYEFEDVESAKCAGRSDFNNMVQFLKKEAKKRDDERCRTVLVEKTDRLYRNIRDYVALGELHLAIHFVKEGSVLSPGSHSSEKFMHGIKVLMAKHYIDNLSEETKKGLQEKAEQGIWPKGAPLGYRNVQNAAGKKMPEPDPNLAPVVRRLFETYSQGTCSLSELVLVACDEGLVAPRSGKPIHRSHVHKILRNPFYYGQFRWKGKRYEGIHEPLVSRELWDKVQDVLQNRGTKKPKKCGHSFAFTGLMNCGHCGCSLVGEMKKKRYVYYHCTGYKGKCPEPYVREEVLEQKFSEILRQLVFDDETLGWISSALRGSHAEEKRFHAEAIDRLQAEHVRLQNRIDTAYDDRLDGRIAADFYDLKAGQWRDEQARIRDTIERHQQANRSFMDLGITLIELASRAADLFEKQEPREKRRLLNFVLSNCSWANGELTPTFRQPFDMIADAATACAKEKAAGANSDDLCLLRGG